MTFSGKEYKLQQYPHHVRGSSKYQAACTGEDGKRYTLFWDTKPDYDGMWEFGACDWNNPSEVK